MIEGLAGNDRIFGVGGHDIIRGRGGNDQLFGGTGNDILDGGVGADRMIGGIGNDTFVVGQLRDRVEELANGGNDLVRSSISWTLTKHVERLELTGAAHLHGTGNGAANAITGNAGGNVLKSLDGNDKLFGRAGNDSLYGGSGNDTLFGGAGSDTLVGGAGRDVLHGGAGRDQFVFFFAEHSGTTANTRDRITTFVSGQDRINISAIDADTTRRGNQASLFDVDKMSANATLDRGQVGWHQADRAGTADDRTIVRFNIDNDRDYEMKIEIKGLINLDASDFLL